MPSQRHDSASGAVEIKPRQDNSCDKKCQTRNGLEANWELWLKLFARKGEQQRLGTCHSFHAISPVYYPGAQIDLWKHVNESAIVCGCCVAYAMLGILKLL